MEDVVKKNEELTEVLKALEKLLIQLISIIGWLLILMKLF